MNINSSNRLDRVLNEGDVCNSGFYSGLCKDDRLFVNSLISHYPRHIQSVLIKQYRNEKTPFDANSILRKSTEKINQIIPKSLEFCFDAGEEELRRLAVDFSDRCLRISSNFTGRAYEAMADYAVECGVVPPEPKAPKTLEGCIKRLQDKGWWLRNLRKLLNRSREEVMIYLNEVNRKKGIYVSDITASNRIAQKEKQLKMMESITLKNGDGDEFSLKDIYNKNISNPVLRRNELMTRMRGFEDVSLEFGHVGLFITMTCPSKYHRAYAKSGMANNKWGGFTPFDAQKYLCLTWSRIRAALQRLDIRVYGLRVAEPQHDGTPHWHLMLFFDKSHLNDIKMTVKEYCLQEDGEEKGAVNNRCDFKLIDPNKGSATGYVAKYICKNIDGANLDEGIYGECPIMAAQRVEAWASTWGIRQFQQIGGTSVTVWRELRRVKAEYLKSMPEEFQEIRKAADSSNWSAFTKLMGGVFCRRNDQKVKPYYKQEFNEQTGVIKQSWFDGLFTKKIKGVLYGGVEVLTRFHEWQIFKVDIEKGVFA